MALFYFLILGLCITCCQVDAGRKSLLNDIASNRAMRQVDDEFDCVDIYKQPALQHPLLKNHKIQLYPTFAKKVVRSQQSSHNKCPSGKVPIYKKNGHHQIVTNSSSKLPNKDLRYYARSTHGFHAVSLDTTQNKVFYGVRALICSAYNLSLDHGQYSTSSIMVESGPPTELNTIHAGVGFRPDIYGDSQLRLTTLWTSFHSTNDGCSDNTCAGFVQVAEDKAGVLGAVTYPTAPVGSSNKYCLAVKIQRDQSTGNWWLISGDDEISIGYWPKDMFNHLNDGATRVRFGGETYAAEGELSPPMGSGRLPKDGYQYSALFAQLQYIDSEYSHIDVIAMQPFSDTKPECYDTRFNDEAGKVFRQTLLYGGPGGNCDV